MRQKAIQTLRKNITEVNITDVSNEICSYQDVTFAVNDEESNYTIESQEWYSEEAGRITPLSTHLKPTVGEKYTFSITLKAKDGYEFADPCSVMIDGVMISAQNVHKTQNGLLITAVKTIVPVSQKETGDSAVKPAGATVKPGSITAPKTGDNSNLMLWTVLVLISGGVLISVRLSGKNRKFFEK